MTEPELFGDRLSRLEMSIPPLTQRKRGKGGAFHEEYRNAFVYVSALDTETVTPGKGERGKGFLVRLAQDH